MNSFPLIPNAISHLFMKNKSFVFRLMTKRYHEMACLQVRTCLSRNFFFIDIYVIIVFIIQNLSPHMISVRTTARLLHEASDKYLRIIFYQRLAPLLYCVYAALCHWLNTYHHRSLHKGAVGVYARIKNACTRSCSSIVEAATESTTSIP